MLARRLALGSLFLAGCVGDSPGPPDSSSDAGVADAPIEAATTFCSAHTTAAFCEDFDRSPNPPWSLTVMSEALGQAGANVSSFTSPPRSVAFSLAPATAAFQGSFLGAVVATSTAVGARLSLSVRFELLDTTVSGQQDFFILRTDGVGGLTIHRTVSNGTEAWSFGPTFAPIDTPALNQWYPVVIDATFDAAGDAAAATTTLTFGGKTYAPSPSSTKAPTNTVGILLGGQSDTATSPKVHYSIDDVVLELH